MPIYQYRCQEVSTSKLETTPPDVAREQPELVQCGHIYEVFYTSFGAVEREEPEAECEVCGGKNKTKLISQGTSHILKGKGWYRDGY